MMSCLTNILSKKTWFIACNSKCLNFQVYKNTFHPGFHCKIAFFYKCNEWNDRYLRHHLCQNVILMKRVVFLLMEIYFDNQMFGSLQKMIQWPLNKKKLKRSTFRQEMNLRRSESIKNFNIHWIKLQFATWMKR